jgi:HPt (histidine-containing phosphotransfer) domain-containing protein
VGGDEDIYRELLADFAVKLPEKIANLERCFSEDNMEGLSRGAHNIKGVASNLGALQLCEYAGRLEKCARQGYTKEPLEKIVREIKEISRKFSVDASNYLSGHLTG